MSDDPIKPYEGDKPVGNVIDLAGVKIRWGISTTRYGKECKHHSLVYDQKERRIWCDGCSRSIDSFDAFMSIANKFGDMAAEATRNLDKSREAMRETAIRRSAKALDHIWRGKMVPCCPHCRKGLMAHDFENGASSSISKELEIARRNRDQGK